MFSLLNLLVWIIVLIEFTYSQFQQLDTISNATQQEKTAVKRQFLIDNQRLFNYLFADYNSALPPVYTKRAGILNFTRDEPIVPDKDEFEIVLMYAKLLEVNPPKQLLTLIFEYLVAWKDVRLRWNPADFGGINHIYVLRRNVWTPEVTPFDSTDIEDTRPEYKQYIAIAYTGDANFYTTTLTSVTCHIDVLYFPFDMQNCSIKLLSYTFFSQEISLSSKIFVKALPQDMGTEEWAVVSVNAVSMLMYNDSGLDATQVNEFTFLLRRNPSYYVSLIIIPSFILTFLCILGLFSTEVMDTNMDKFTMGLTTMMSTTVVIGIVTDNIPKTKMLPHMCAFILMNLVIIGVAIMVIVYLPKCKSMIKCCLRKRNIKSRRQYGKWCMILINILIFVLFEVCVVLNMYFLICGSKGFPFLQAFSSKDQVTAISSSSVFS